MHVFRLHGRGGQGVDTARRILGRAAFLSGMHVQDFTLHQLERRGHATTAYVKASKTPIISRDTAEPDFVLVLDPGLEDALTGVKEETIAIFNTDKLTQAMKKKTKSYYLPATDIALEAKSRYPNTAMLGALCKIFIKLSLRSIKNAAELEGVASAENSAAIDQGFRSVKRG